MKRKKESKTGRFQQFKQGPSTKPKERNSCTETEFAALKCTKLIQIEPPSQFVTSNLTPGERRVRGGERNRSSTL